MTTARILLHAYYERLHETMVARRERLLGRIDDLLMTEIDRCGLGPISPERTQAYREACQAFVKERLEAYNPIGIQYTFESSTSRLAAELEFQLDWYDSRAEFQELVAAAQGLARDGIPDQGLDDAVDQLIRQVGAFPDRSIIAAYAAKPTGQKLPDFIVASAIEQIVCRSEPQD